MRVKPILRHQGVAKRCGVLDRRPEGGPLAVVVDPDDKGMVGAQGLIKKAGLISDVKAPFGCGFRNRSGEEYQYRKKEAAGQGSTLHVFVLNKE